MMKFDKIYVNKKQKLCYTTIQFNNFDATVSIIKPYKNIFGNSFVDENWLFNYRKYKYVKGFIFRFCGVDINVKEPNATEKLCKPMMNKY